MNIKSLSDYKSDKSKKTEKKNTESYAGGAKRFK
jgi:hypothetical protein